MESISGKATLFAAEIKTFSEGQAYHLRLAEQMPSEAPMHRVRAAACGMLVKIRELWMEELLDAATRILTNKILDTPSEDGRFLLDEDSREYIAALEVIVSARAGHGVVVNGIAAVGDNIEISYTDLS